MTSLLENLRRRKVAQWTVAYLAAAWVLLQVLDLVGDSFNWPTVIGRIAIVVLAIGLLAAGVVAWFHGERGHQKVGASEAVLLVVIALAAGLGSVLVVRATQTTTVRAAAVAGTADLSIAVLPFQNMSTSKENEYFADGITEDVLTNLSKIASLRVTSRTSVMRYKGTDRSIPDIARELGVAHILEGSVRRDGNRVLITAQLIRAGTDEHLWAESYERDLADIFAVQREIAAHITAALQTKLTPGDRASTATGRTASIEAYDLHLRGRELLRAAGSDDEDQRAMVLFRRALELDPSFALAEASLSEVQLSLSERDSAFAAARRAIALEPDLAEGHAALAGAYRVGGQFREALVEAHRAVHLNPSNALAIGEIGYMTGEMGALDEALPWTKRAVALEPTSARFAFGMASIYRQLGSYPEADHWIRRASVIATEPAYFTLAMAALYRGDRVQAAAWTDSLAASSPESTGLARLRLLLGDYKPIEPFLDTLEPDEQGLLRAFMLQRQGRHGDAERYLALEEQRAHQRIADGDQVRAPGNILTHVHALRGDRDRAIAALRDWIDHGLRDPNELLHNPMLASLHADPEFIAIVEQMRRRQEQMRARARREGWW